MEIEIQANIAKSLIINSYNKSQATQITSERSSSRVEQFPMPPDPTETVQASGSELVSMQSEEQFQIVKQIEDEAVPINMKMPTEGNDQELNTSEWVQQHITKLSAELGIDFQGCEEKAKELFKKIDSNKQQNGETQVTAKKKGSNKLRSLEIDNKFWSYGSRSKGDIFQSKINEFENCFLECEGVELWEEERAG